MPRCGAYLSPSLQRPAFPYWDPFHPPAHRGRCGQMCLSKTKHRVLFEEKGRRETARGITCKGRNATSLAGRHAWLICEDVQASA